MFGSSKNSPILAETISIPHRPLIGPDSCPVESCGFMGGLKKFADNKIVQAVVVIGMGAGLFYAFYYYQ